MSRSFRATKVLVDRAALRHNLELLKSRAPGAFFCPMLKANAYGHGDVIVAREAESVGASAVGVALIEEGLRLRAHGLNVPVLVFAPFDEEGARAMIDARLTPVVTRPEDLEALAAVGRPTPIHVKFNTGMQRLGFDAHERAALVTRLRALPFLRVEGVCTHLTHGDEFATGEASRHQLKLFEEASRDLPGVRHVHKSASLRDDGLGARPGIGVYGLPHEGRAVGPGLKRVLSWVSRLERVHEVEAGEAVGYSARWRAARRSRIGVVPCGYADGYPRLLSNRGEMLFRGRRVPVVGSVCMDYTFVDLTDAVNAGLPRVGEEITLVGRQGDEEILAVELAEKMGTIAYEVVTAISARVPREVS